MAKAVHLSNCFAQASNCSIVSTVSYWLFTTATSSAVFLTGLFFKGLNSNSKYSLAKASSSLFRTNKLSKSVFRSRSLFKDTSSIFLSRLGRNSLRLFPTTPGKDSAFALIVSRSVNSLSHFAAVF